MNSTININSRKRIEKDVMKLLLSDYDVKLKNESKLEEFSVVFKGPKDSPYEDGEWTVNVLLPDQYPYKSPSIGFVNKIYHPNIDEASGSVCLDVINQTWSPMYELKNIFDVFLPQLLCYPNPTDPLNASAAKMLLNDKTKYEKTIKEYILKYATIKKNVNSLSSLKICNKNNNKNDDSNLRKLSTNANSCGSFVNKIVSYKKKDDEHEEDELSVLSAASDYNLNDDDFNLETKSIC